MMIIRQLASLILLLVSVTAFAQFPEPGYIVTNTGDTLRGTIKYGTPAQRTVKIVFTDAKTKESTKYEPFQIKEYYVEKEKSTYESEIYQQSLEDEFGYGVFMKRLNNGMVAVYEYWNTDGERGFIQTFIKRGKEKLVSVNYMDFTAQMTEYFDDFPQLSAKIERGAFKKKQLVKIAEEYNKWRDRKW